MLDRQWNVRTTNLGLSEYSKSDVAILHQPERITEELSKIMKSDQQQRWMRVRFDVEVNGEDKISHMWRKQVSTTIESNQLSSKSILIEFMQGWYIRQDKEKASTQVY